MSEWPFGKFHCRRGIRQDVLGTVFSSKRAKTLTLTERWPKAIEQNEHGVFNLVKFLSLAKNSSFVCTWKESYCSYFSANLMKLNFLAVNEYTRFEEVFVQFLCNGEK